MPDPLDVLLLTPRPKLIALAAQKTSMAYKDILRLPNLKLIDILAQVEDVLVPEATC